MKALEEHQQRVVAEKADLDAKIAKLQAFKAGPTWTGLPGAERGRLDAQFSIMQAYSRILEMRIAAFSV